MSHLEILILAIALSIDACVVSFSYGLIFSRERVKNSMLLASCTGLFQALMPVIGYFLTAIVKTFVEPFAPIIVFAIFTYLGVKFIIEAFETEKKKNLCLDFKCLLLVGIATSIDAFSAGISLSLFGNRILKPAVLIGVVTFVNSISGFYLGGKFKHLPTRSLEVGAGLLLIVLGIKSLLV